MNGKANHIISFFHKHRSFFVCMLLAITTLAVYWNATGHDFVNYDDDEYVYENTNVKNGLTSDSITWAFTAIHSYNWHPLTWLSHTLDCQLFGLNAGLHHLVNIIFHIGNTLLVFIILKRMTGDFLKSLVVAGLFALPTRLRHSTTARGRGSGW